MTDRVSHLVVTLAEPMHADEIKPLLMAIWMLKNVADVTQHFPDHEERVDR